jgi:hypothetical protein
MSDTRATLAHQLLQATTKKEARLKSFSEVIAPVSPRVGCRGGLSQVDPIRKPFQVLRHSKRYHLAVGVRYFGRHQPHFHRAFHPAVRVINERRQHRGYLRWAIGEEHGCAKVLGPTRDSELGQVDRGNGTRITQQIHDDRGLTLHAATDKACGLLRFISDQTPVTPWRAAIACVARSHQFS